MSLISKAKSLVQSAGKAEKSAAGKSTAGKSTGKTVRKMVTMMLILILLILGVLLLSDWIVGRAAGSRASDDPGSLPKVKSALVLGTSRYLPGGRVNLYFRFRLEAAKELLDRGVVSYLIVSGDNERFSYNEPVEMKKALEEMGVEKGRIVLDYAGFRTLDSVVRCREVFGQEQFIIVSQRFHNERALFIAQKFGIDAYAYNAKDVGGTPGAKVRLREYFARVKAILDLYLLGTGPRFLGESVEIPSRDVKQPGE
jgi:SanA protein